MARKFFFCIFLIPVLLWASESQSDSCLSCMRSVTVTHEGCKHCAHYVQQMMSASSIDQLTGLVASLKKTAYKNCGEHGLQSKACQVYHALCQDDHACDHELLSRLSDLKEPTVAVAGTLVA